MSHTTVYVKNISPRTGDKEIREFFNFCGKIKSIDFTTEGETKKATVIFEREAAAHTAILLNKTLMHGNELIIEGAVPAADDSASKPSEPSQAERGQHPGLMQEEKPRSRILAEVLAHGYVVADAGLAKAIALDEKHGVSARFVHTLKQLDEKTHATNHARAADASYGISQRASSLLTGLSSYFEKARDTPTGKRVVGFYTTSQRQVHDIHNEARRLADLRKEETGGSLYKAVGLDKVFGDRFHQGSASPPANVAPGAPANAPATTQSAQQPAAPAGTGNPEVIP